MTASPAGQVDRLVGRMVGRDVSEEHRASTTLELLFDLTFVVAVSRAAAQLASAVAAGDTAHALGGYAMVFFAIWWAWVNFSWFASAYDTDDVPYRLLTLVQMGGVLVLAASIPRAFASGDFRWVVVGYLIMRVALVGQWLRAAHDDRAGRRRALRYAAGVSVVQVGWVLRLLLPGSLGTVSFVVLAVAEVLVPVWSERGGMTPWHPEHIAERYGLFTLIVLGESVSAAALAVQSALNTSGVTVDLVAAASGGLLLVFGCWWVYFLRPAADGLRERPRISFVWGYLHYGVFGSLAALGAGLEVVTEVTAPTHEAGDRVGHIALGLAVAVPVAVFLALVGILHTTLGVARPPRAVYLVAAAATLVLGPVLAEAWKPAAALAPAIPLAGVIAFGLRGARRSVESGAVESGAVESGAVESGGVESGGAG